jgi:hypothetical protein
MSIDGATFAVFRIKHSEGGANYQRVYNLGYNLGACFPYIT